jgi:hypothetical protein
MPHIKKLGQQLLLAQSMDIPAELLVQVLMTSNAKRLGAIFQAASVRLLATHQRVQQRPSSAFAVLERNRNKALLDFVRARMAAIGCRKPAVDKMLALMDGSVSRNVVEMRRVA